MLTVYRWNKERRTGGWEPTEKLAELGDSLRDSNVVFWIDLENPTADEEKFVFESVLRVHALTLEDITKPRREPETLPHFPKVEEFPDYLFVVVNPLDRLPSDGGTGERFDGRPKVRQLSAILTRSLLITHHYVALNSIQQLRDYLLKHPQQVDRGPDYLFHLVLDAMVDEYAPALDRISDRLDEMEDEVFGQPTRQMLSDMLQLKRDIVAIRKTLILEREVLARLTRGEFSLIDEREMAYYRNVYDHLVRYAELIEGAREMVSDLMQTHLAAVSNKLSEIMKTLTMISTIVLPMSLIAGIYGMNFKRWFPELEWEYGYPFALALMALAGVGGYLLFKWRKWI